MLRLSCSGEISKRSILHFNSSVFLFEIVNHFRVNNLLNACVISKFVMSIADGSLLTYILAATNPVSHNQYMSIVDDDK